MARRVPQRMTDRVAARLGEGIDTVTPKAGKVPGPSPDPATNLLLVDILVRGVDIMARQVINKGLLRPQFGPDRARQIVENRSLARSLGGYLAARVATRSVPGAMVVGTGLLAKTLYDRTKPRRAARRDGLKSLSDQAKGE